MLAIEQANTNAIPELDGLQRAWESADTVLKQFVIA